MINKLSFLGVLNGIVKYSDEQFCLLEDFYGKDLFFNKNINDYICIEYHKVESEEYVSVNNNLAEFSKFSTDIAIIVDRLFYGDSSSFEIQTIDMATFTALVKHIFRRERDFLDLRYFCLGIASLLTIKGLRVVDPDFQRIKEIISIKSAEQNFCLSHLASYAYMSRRKVQYILERNETTFRNEVDISRFERFNSYIQQDKKNKIDDLIFKSGFKSTTRAKEMFEKVYGISIKEYLSKPKKG